MSNVPLPVGTDLSYLVLAVIFFWIAFGFVTFVHYRKKWMARGYGDQKGPNKEEGAPEERRKEEWSGAAPRRGAAA